MKFALIADETQKPAFFPGWQAFLFGAIMVFVLWILYPRALFQKTLEEKAPSAATLSYLKAYARQYPENTRLRYSLIEQALAMEEPDEAENTFAQLKAGNLSPDAATRYQYTWIEYLLLRYKANHAKLNTKERIQYLTDLRKMAESMAKQPLGKARLIQIAQDNMGLGQVDIALKIYNDLFDKNRLMRAEEFAEGGSIAMQNNAQRDSAKFYWAAYQKASSDKDKKTWALAAIRALWAGNLVDEALALTKKVPDKIINERSTLLFLSRLALAANQPKIAQEYALKALLISKEKNEK